MENSTEILQVLISDITGCKVVSLHTDISTKTGERFIIITPDDDLERKTSFSRNSMALFVLIQYLGNSTTA
ncbi:MAG: DUF2294 family protein [Deltaproteobacteria bacterium]|nr:DUF2294 family protein [Deltaproteobacteria bacterium]MBW1994696.1 DUF2294 family protein [Deltaproteobacteria bacterium]